MDKEYLWIMPIDKFGKVIPSQVQFYEPTTLSIYRLDKRKLNSIAVGYIDNIPKNNKISDNEDILKIIFYRKDEEVPISHSGPCQLRHVYNDDQFKIYYKNVLQVTYWPNSSFTSYLAFMKECLALKLDVPEYLINNK